MTLDLVDILKNEGSSNLQVRREQQLTVLMNTKLEIFTNTNSIHDYSTRNDEYITLHSPS